MTRQLLIGLVTAALGIGVYHAFFARPSPEPTFGTPARGDEAAGPERKAATLHGDAAQSAARRLDALEGRIAGLEGQGHAAPSPGPSAVGGRWTDERLGVLEAALAEIERRKVEKRETESARRTVVGAGVVAGSDEERTATAAVAGYFREIRRLFPDGSGGKTLAERVEAAKRAGQAHDALEIALRSLVTDEAAARIVGAVPQVAVPVDTAPNPAGGGK